MSAVVLGTQPWTAAVAMRLKVDHAAHLDMALAIRPDWLFVLHYGRKIPLPVLDGVTAVNVHATPLPYGRGGHPIENMILRGHSETVLTAHQLTAELDAGPIYGRSGPVSLDGTKGEILARFVTPSVALLRQLLVDTPEPRPQVGHVTRFRRLSPEDYAAFWRARRGRAS